MGRSRKVDAPVSNGRAVGMVCIGGDILQRIDRFRARFKAETGFEISTTAAVKTMLSEALDKRDGGK